MGREDSRWSEHKKPAELAPSVTGAVHGFAACMLDGIRPSRFVFQDPNPQLCAAVAYDELKCALTGQENACRRTAHRKRDVVDPYGTVWQPRPAYVTRLALQRRLPYQVDQERRLGVRVAVPPVAPSGPPRTASQGTAAQGWADLGRERGASSSSSGGGGGRNGGPPPSSGVALFTAEAPSRFAPTRRLLQPQRRNEESCWAGLAINA
jgi:hypothetical protein